MEEAILAQGCREGDNAARRELYDRYAARLMAVCLRYAGERSAAEDLLHDAFLKIYGAFDRFEYRGPGSLRAWMERIAVNMVLEWLRRRSRSGIVAMDESRLPEPAEEPDSQQIAAIPQQELLRLVASLPEGYRTVFNLYCIEGYSHRDIAQMLGINEKSSSSQLFRARALLARKVRGYLQDHGL